MKKNKNLQNPVNPCYGCITVGGGGKPAPLAAFSRIELLKDLNSSQNSPHKKPAFTLAEVLITLAIIGIVAALTIPGLMNKINSKVVENQKKVMNNKIVQGLNLLNSQENGLTKTYANSEEFVRALSKYMKMTTICGAGNLKDCFAYDKVNYDKDGEVKSVELSSITTASKLKLDNSFLAPAGFVMGDGTPVIVAWNSKCASGAQDATILDPDQPLKGIPTSCFDGIYDNSGTRNPNMYGKDVLPFGAAKIGTSYPGVEIPGIGYVYMPNGTGYMTPEQALAYDSEELKKWDATSYESFKNQHDFCSQYPEDCVSYWGGAKKMCAELGMDLPTIEELRKMDTVKSEYSDLLYDYVWSSVEKDWGVAYFDFATGTEGIENPGNGVDVQTLCVGK